jgi:hypothetical protein
MRTRVRLPSPPAFARRAARAKAATPEPPKERRRAYVRIHKAASLRLGKPAKCEHQSSRVPLRLHSRQRVPPRTSLHRFDCRSEHAPRRAPCRQSKPHLKIQTLARGDSSRLSQQEESNRFRALSQIRLRTGVRSTPLPKYLPRRRYFKAPKMGYRSHSDCQPPGFGSRSPVI